MLKFIPEKGKNSYDKDKVVNVKLQVVDYYVSNFGGIDIDDEIFSEIKQKFDTTFKTNLDITQGRVYKKLLGEIDKLKNKLSANKKNKLFMEGLDMDNVFNDFISRDEINENLLKVDYLRRIFRPLRKLLDRNKIQLSDLKDVEFIGGA